MLVSIDDQNGPDKSIFLVLLDFYAYQHRYFDGSLSMHTSNLAVVFTLWQPRHVRVWRQLQGIASMGWRAAIRAWNEHDRRARLRREWRALAELNPNTLKDIGAPDWLIASAGEQMDQHSRRLMDANHWR